MEVRERSQAATRQKTEKPQANAQQARTQEARRTQQTPAPAKPQDTYTPTSTNKLDSELRNFQKLGRAHQNRPQSGGIDLGYDVADMPKLRGQLDELGRRYGTGPINGQGVPMGFIDQYNESNGELGPHGRRVTGFARDLAPGAPQHNFSPVQGGQDSDDIPRTFPADMPDDPAQLDRYLRGRNAGVDSMNDRLQQLLATNPELRVLNISMGPTRRPYYDQLLERLNQRGEDGNFTSPNLRAEILRGEDLTDDQLRERIARYVDQRLEDPQSGYQQSLRDYENTTRQFEERGTALVVAAGNAGGSEWDRFSPGSGLNLLARSPHVISVGAADNNGIRPDSSFGDPNGFRPTLTGPGSATSYSTPVVSAVIANMMQANPNLSVDDIRKLLKRASTCIDGVDPRQQGAGLLDPVWAVELALQAR